MTTVNASIHPIFILGSQRSGTTLLRLMLNAHSRIAIPEEGGFWMPILRDYKRGKLGHINKSRVKRYTDYIKKNPQFALWDIEAASPFAMIEEKGTITLSELMYLVYNSYASASGKQIWGDKTPSFFRMVLVLKDLFPDAKFIHIVRDGRDIYLSLRKLDSSKRNVSVQALEWVYKVRKAKRDLATLSPSQVFEIRYEDLIHSSAETLNELCHFLKVSYEPEMLEYWKTSDQFIGAHHSKLIFQPVSSKSVCKWKTQMTERELKRYETFAGALLKSYGYELSNHKRSTIVDYLLVAMDLMIGLPNRAARIFLTALNMRLAANFGIRLFSEKVGKLPGNQTKNKEFTH